MTLLLIGKGLLLEASPPQTKDKQVQGIYIYVYMCIYVCVIQISTVYSHNFLEQKLQTPKNGRRNDFLGESHCYPGNPWCFFNGGHLFRSRLFRATSP